MVVLLPLHHFQQSTRAAIAQLNKKGSLIVRGWCERLHPSRTTRICDYRSRHSPCASISQQQPRRRHLTYFEPLPKPGGRGDWPKADPLNELLHMEKGSFKPRHYQKAKNVIDRFLQHFRFKVHEPAEANALQQQQQYVHDIIQLLQRLLDESTLSSGHVRFSFFAHPPYLNALLTKWKEAFVTFSGVPVVDANDRNNNHHRDNNIDDQNPSSPSTATIPSPMAVLQLLETLAMHFPENQTNLTALGILLEAQARTSSSSLQIRDRVLAFTRQELETSSNHPGDGPLSSSSSSSNNATTITPNVVSVDGTPPPP